MVDEEGFGYEAPYLGTIQQLTTHAYTRVPKKQPIGFRVNRKGKTMKEQPSFPGIAARAAYQDETIFGLRAAKIDIRHRMKGLSKEGKIKVLEALRAEVEQEL